MKSIREAEIKGKTVLVRVDYNVPMENGKITDDLRIRASLPTLEFLREQGAKKIILISHLGRPEGYDKALSLKPVATALGKILPDVGFVGEVSGLAVKDAVSKIKPGGILLLENLRFYPGEKENSEDFIREIIEATSPDLYIQDGFAVLHRKHASVAAVQKCLPVYTGLLVEKELENLEKVIKNPVRPLLFIIGGAKVEDKAPYIEEFAKFADYVIVGGKIAADGYQANNPKIYVAEDFDEDTSGAKLDVGPVSTIKIAELIEKSKTIVWNGLLGKAEDPAYSTASNIVAELLGQDSDKQTVICGGDTTGFVDHLMQENPELHYSLVSTGGGASLEFMKNYSHGDIFVL